MKILKAIGIRAVPKEIHYAILSKEKDNDVLELIVVSKIIVPLCLNFPEQLKYIRFTFLDLLYEYNIQKAGLRVTEAIAQANIIRVSIEAVLQELLASSSVESYYLGRIANISSKIGIKHKEFKGLLSRETKFDRVQNWNSYSSNDKESILTCMGALEI